MEKIHIKIVKFEVENLKLKICIQILKSRMKIVWHWMDGWMGGWTDGRVGFRIAYSNQKLRFKVQFLQQSLNRYVQVLFLLNC